MEFLDTERHLLGSTDQERGEADSISIDLNSFVQNSVEWDLFAQIIHRVAVIAQDRVNQVFADIVYITENSCQYYLALRIAFLFFQIAFQVGDSAFHDLCRLQDERQDQLTSAKAVTDIFHRWQQHSVQHIYSSIALLDTLRLSTFSNNLVE